MNLLWFEGKREIETNPAISFMTSRIANPEINDVVVAIAGIIFPAINFDL